MDPAVYKALSKRPLSVNFFDMPESTLSPQIAADRAQVSRRTIMDAIKDGTLDAYQDDQSRWQVYTDSLLTWLSNREDKITTQADQEDASKQDFLSRIRKLEGVFELRERHVSELQSDRDAWKEQARLLAEPRSLWERIFRNK